MDHPMLKITLAFAAGILLNDLLPLPVLLWVTGFWLVVCCFVTLQKTRSAWLAGMLITSGACIHAMHTRPVNHSDLRHMDLGEGWYVTIEGVLAETPRQKTSRTNGIERHSSLATLEVHQLAHASTSRAGSGRVLIRTSGPLPKSFYKGIPVRVTGVLATPPRPMAEGLFDYQAYLEHQGIHHILYAQDTHAWTVNADKPSLPNRPWTDRFREWAMASLSYGLPELDDATRLRWAMVLGLKSWLHEDMIEPFRWSGSMHLFAISGLHVAMVSGLIFAGVRLFLRSRWCAGTCVLVALWCYVAITGWQTSAIRAGIMTSVVLTGWMLNKPHTMLNSLFTAAWFVLIWQPTQLFQIGFQLSFGVVLGLITASEPIQGCLTRWLESDPWILKEHLTKLQKTWNWGVRKIASAVSISLAAWIGSLPIIWQHFHLVTPIGLVGNVLMVPLAGATMTCALGSMACHAWAPWLTELFNHSGWFWMQCMVHLSHWMASTPLSHFNVSPLPDPFLWYYYALLLSMALGLTKRTWTKWTGFVSAGVASFILLMHFHQAWVKEELAFLPIADGDAIWMNQAGVLDDLLMDGGNDRAVKRTTIPFLESRGVNRLKDFWVSHGDADHIGGYEALVDHFHPERVISFSEGYRSPYYRGLMAMAKEKGLILKSTISPDTFGSLEMLYPLEEKGYRKADDAYLVSCIKWQGCRILLAGDLSREGIIALSNRYPDLQADILVLNRPKDGASPNTFWIDSLNPQCILITGIPPGRKDRWVNALRQHRFLSNPSIWDSGTHGMVKIEKMEKQVRVTPSKGEPMTILHEGADSDQTSPNHYGTFGSMMFKVYGLVRRLSGLASGKLS